MDSRKEKLSSFGAPGHTPPHIRFVQVWPSLTGFSCPINNSLTYAEIFAIWVKFPVDVYPTRLHSHWTIWEFDSRIPDAGNSDPDKLREKAAELETLSADELLKRQMEIKVTK